jgi:hypothetical protein
MRLSLPLMVLAGCSSGDLPANMSAANAAVTRAASGNSVEADTATAQPAALPVLDRARFAEWCQRDYRTAPGTTLAQAEEFCRDEWVAVEAGVPIADALASLVPAAGGRAPTLDAARAAFAQMRWSAPSRDTRELAPDALAEARTSGVAIVLRGRPEAVTTISFDSYVPEIESPPVIANWADALRARGATTTDIGCPEAEEGSYGAYGPPEEAVVRLEIPGRAPIAYLTSSSYLGRAAERPGTSMSQDVDMTGTVPTLDMLRSGRWRIIATGGPAVWNVCAVS